MHLYTSRSYKFTFYDFSIHSKFYTIFIPHYRNEMRQILCFPLNHLLIEMRNVHIKFQFSMKNNRVRSEFYNYKVTSHLYYQCQYHNLNNFYQIVIENIIHWLEFCPLCFIHATFNGYQHKMIQVNLCIKHVCL